MIIITYLLAFTCLARTVNQLSWKKSKAGRKILNDYHLVILHFTKLLL